MGTRAFVHLACVFLVGVINLLPVLGLLGGARLEAAYGIRIDGTEVDLLLRHRALLFGLIGGLVLASLGLPHLRHAVLVLAALSMAGFIALLLLAGPVGPRQLARIAVVDGSGLPLVAAALLLERPSEG